MCECLVCDTECFVFNVCTCAPWDWFDYGEYGICVSDFGADEGFVKERANF